MQRRLSSVEALWFETGCFFLQHNIIEAITQHTSSINPHWEEVYSGRSRGDGSIIKLHALRDATQWQREKAVFLT